MFGRLSLISLGRKENWCWLSVRGIVIWMARGETGGNYLFFVIYCDFFLADFLEFDFDFDSPHRVHAFLPHTKKRPYIHQNDKNSCH